MAFETEQEATFAPAAVAQMTGLSAHVLRAWERRYGAVEPLRTVGGARRYSERDVQRLRLLRRAVDAGHPISQVARLADAEVLRRLDYGAGARLEPTPEDAAPPVEEILEAVRAMEVGRVERSLSLQLAALGPRAFAQEVATPLLERIGEEWERGELAVAAEHMATSVLRSLLGSALREENRGRRGPTILFATPSGERHEIGTLIAATYALGVGARAVFLGPDLPAAELAGAARRLGAAAVAVGVAGSDPDVAERELRTLRRALPASTRVWLGGHGAALLRAIPGIEIINRLEELEAHVSGIR